jgi:hypothetical protein
MPSGDGMGAAAHRLRVTSNGRIITGLGTVLGRLGAKPNDWLLLLVDGQLMEAHACIGNEEESRRCSGCARRLTRFDTNPAPYRG